ncbi:hypothetical protein Tco_1005012 [Tanacetum coccineum]|uniref:Uncharacterized protein n=1 Tax=Tanacetum coccineum TaxID=301880 RepID=A0ABQ5FEI7_9ASTR
MTESPLVDSNFAVRVFSPGDDLITCLNKAMAFLTFIASSNTGYKSNATSYGGIMQADKQGLLNATTVKTKDLDTYDFDCDDLSNAQAILIANIFNYGFDVSQKEKLASKEQVDSLEQNLSKQIKEKECYQDPFHLKKAQRIKPTWYDGIVMSDKHVSMHVIDDEETLILEEKSRLKMSEKANDPEIINKNISYKPIDYDKLNRLSKDFRKRFTPQQEMDVEQAFWLHISNPTSKPSDVSLVKIEAPKELPKVILVNESLKKLKFHLSRFDNVVKIRTTPDAHTEGKWGFEHTKAVFNNEIIPFLKSLKDIFNVFDRDLLNEIMKKELLLENDRLLQQIMSQEVMLTMINSMSLIGDTVNMDGKRKESCNLEAELLKSQNAFNEFFVNNDLKAQLQDKDSTICKLKDIIKLIREKSKEENVKSDYYEIETKNVELDNKQSDSLIDKLNLKSTENEDLKGMFKLDLEPLAPRLLQNTEAHIDYLKYTQEQNDIVWEIVEQAKAEHPLDKELDFACKHAQRIQELLVYVQDRCPNAINLSAKKVVVTPKNKVKKVRLTEPLTSSSNSK